MSEKGYEAERDKVMNLEEEMRNMPREVRDVLHPVRLTEGTPFQFRCHPEISCFNKCCANIEILLTPYDMLRLRRRLGLTAEQFLYQYANPHTLSKGQLPVAMMAMDKETGKCPFVTDAGCSVYEDRPVTCRYYPIGLALMHRQQEAGEEEFYFLIKEDYCQGHRESNRQTVAEWRRDQGSDGYDEQNRGWMEIILKRRSAGDAVSTSLQVSEFFYMASTNPEKFREFVFNSSFLERFDVDSETRQRLKTDDDALTAFAFSWLKTVLFGDKEVAVKPEAIKKKRAKKTTTAADGTEK